MGRIINFYVIGQKIIAIFWKGGGKLPLELRTESNSTLRDSNCARMLHPNIRKNILPCISDILEIMDDLKRPEAQEEPGNTDKAKEPGNTDKTKEPIQELTGKFPTTEVLNDVFNFNIFPLNKKVNTSTSDNDVPANSTDATYSNEAKNSNETKEFEKSIVPNQHLRNDHELEGKSPHGCPKCGKLFKFQGAMKNHIKRVHWKEI